MQTTGHEQHERHEHVHGPGCGHQSVQHENHTDYLHDGHRHAMHGGHWDEHVRTTGETSMSEGPADRPSGVNDVGGD